MHGRLAEGESLAEQIDKCQQNLLGFLKQWCVEEQKMQKSNASLFVWCIRYSLAVRFGLRNTPAKKGCLCVFITHTVSHRYRLSSHCGPQIVVAIVLIQYFRLLWFVKQGLCVEHLACPQS